MREIKFRAKSLDTNTMVYFSPYEITNYFPDDGVFYVGNIPFKVGSEQEYTGLKDKNGVEIYEGDIVQMAGKPKQPLWVVAWYENGWQMKLAKIRGRLPENYYVKLSSDRVIEFDEVIGNIYENPELLNTKS